MKLVNCAAVVTGGAGGLGAACGRALATAGARVALFDRNAEVGQPIAKEIGGLYVDCDVSDAISAETAMKQAREAHGPCRVAINCAGIAPAERIVGRDGPMSLEAFAQVIAVNLIGSFNIMRLAAAEMSKEEPFLEGTRREERGVIISTASVAAHEGQIGQAAYAASKGGIAALTLPAAREFARTGIRVMTISPGLFGTSLLLNMPQEVQNSLAATVPFPSRFGDPEEYAALVMHIIDNPMLNGEVIRLDGALRMQPR